MKIHTESSAKLSSLSLVVDFLYCLLSLVVRVRGENPKNNHFSRRISAYIFQSRIGSKFAVSGFLIEITESAERVNSTPKF
jgi:hypothetical protein